MSQTHPPAAPTWEHYLNLTDEQRNALHAIMDASSKDEQPTPEEYVRHRRSLQQLPIAPRAKPGKGQPRFPNALPGHDTGEVKLQREFDAKRDLPAGWGVYSMHDSGGNFRVGNAAEIAWTQIWNNWGLHKGRREEALQAAEQSAPEMGM